MKPQELLSTEKRIVYFVATETLKEIKRHHDTHGKLPEKTQLMDQVLPTAHDFVYNERASYLGDIFAEFIVGAVEYFRRRPKISSPENGGW